MGKMNATRSATMMQACGDVRARLESTTCDTCEDVCWLATITCHGHAGGRDWKASLLYRPHLSQAEATTLVGRLLMGAGGVLTTREREAHLLEHQGTLW